jgi:hypothetical protein
MSSVAGDSSSADTAGVFGINTDAGVGVLGKSQNAEAIRGETGSADTAAIGGNNLNPTGGAGVWGETKNSSPGVVGKSATGPGVYGKSDGGAAGVFDGDVTVTKTLFVTIDVQLTGKDIAEQFDVVGESAADAGSVVVLAGDEQVCVSDKPYDRRVAGVVSGAATYRPALIMGSEDGEDRRPVALTGKVWCKVDADYAPVELGDLLTTSPTLGHAMAAVDPARAFGAVIGKALGSLQSGRGLVPVLIALQ